MRDICSKLTVTTTTSAKASFSQTTQETSREFKRILARDFLSVSDKTFSYSRMRLRLPM